MKRRLTLLDQHGGRLPQGEFQGTPCDLAIVGRSLMIALEVSSSTEESVNSKVEIPTFRLIVRELLEDAETGEESPTFFTCRLVGTKIGAIPPTCLWPQLGFEGFASLIAANDGEKPIDRLLEHWAGRAFEIEVIPEGKGRNQEEQEKRGKAVWPVANPKVRFRVADTFVRPVLFHSDQHGDLRNAIEHGQEDLFLTARGLDQPEFPPSPGATGQTTALDEATSEGVLELQLIFATHQPHRCLGDTFEPALTIRGRKTSYRIRIRDGRIDGMRLASKEEIDPGFYDLICVPVPLIPKTRDNSKNAKGANLSNRLTEDHAVTRAVPALTIRPNRQRLICSRAQIEGHRETTGSITPEEIAYLKVPTPPYYERSLAIAQNASVFARIAPRLVPAGVKSSLPGLVATCCVTPHHGPSGKDSAVDHIEKLGGNGRPLILKPQIGSLACGVVLLWPRVHAGSYRFDIAVRYGSRPEQTEDRPRFDPNDTIIDGCYRPAINIVRDPGVYQRYHIGKYRFSRRTRPSLEEVTKKSRFERILVRMRGVVSFPAKYRGASDPLDICDPKSLRGIPTGRETPLPVGLVVIAHGGALPEYQEHAHLGFQYLTDHLAGLGIIATSIFLGDEMDVDDDGAPNSLFITARAMMISEHILEIRRQFSHIQIDRIGLVGHSMGGNAVAAAVRMNAEGQFKDAEGDVCFHPIHSVLMIAPSDRVIAQAGQGEMEEGRKIPETGHEVIGASRAHENSNVPAPLVALLYGSLDGDISGFNGRKTAFELFDRALQFPKSLAFVIGANHNRFNSEMGNESTHALSEADQQRFLSKEAHRIITKAYAGSLFATTLRTEWVHWRHVYRGEWVPPSVTIGDDVETDVRILYRPHEDDRIVVMDFESPESEGNEDSPATASLRQEYFRRLKPGTFEISESLSVPRVGSLKELDSFAPHETRGILVQWHHDPINRDRPPLLTFFLDPMHRKQPVKNQAAGAKAGERPIQTLTYQSCDAVSFRVGQPFGSTWNTPGEDQDLFVTLTSRKGGHPPVHRSVRVSCFGRIPPPGKRELVSKTTMSTVRIPLSAFTSETLEGFPTVDLACLTQLTFEFAATPSGELWLDDIELVRLEDLEQRDDTSIRKIQKEFEWVTEAALVRQEIPIPGGDRTDNRKESS